MLLPMWMRFRARFAASAALAACCAATPAHAAPTKQECAAAYEATQERRNEGKLQAAREQAVVCSQRGCPAVVQQSCAAWLTEIEASLPTAVFDVRDAAGQETLDVRLYVDGAKVRDRLDGNAVPLDPGEHVLRFEIAGADPIEQRHVIREGDKLRRISVAFGAAGGAAPAPSGTTATAPPAPPPDTGGGAPPLAYVLGGLGIVGVGVFATLGAVALGEKGDLEDSCAPRCKEEQVDSIRTKLIVADVALGVGVISLGVATVLFITAPSDGEAKDPPAAAARGLRFGVAPIEGGGFGLVRGSF
jgi:hypothetical protein